MHEPILGEISASTEQDFLWPELMGRDRGTARDRVRERLFAAERKGYDVVLVWPDLDHNGTSYESLKYSEEALGGIRDFATRRGIP